MTHDDEVGERIDDQDVNEVSNRITRALLIVAGTFFTILGLIGIVLPILPTTPFLLLAAACYARSSKRFYNWLINNKWFGKYIRDYREGKGIPLKTKVCALTILWVTIMLSSIFFISYLWLRVLMIIIAVGVSFHILHIPTLNDN